jgi:hypothetical protein
MTVSLCVAAGVSAISSLLPRLAPATLELYFMARDGYAPRAFLHLDDRLLSGLGQVLDESPWGEGGPLLTADAVGAPC